jgi:hypothetical protein
MNLTIHMVVRRQTVDWPPRSPWRGLVPTNAMTQSEVPRRMNPGHGREIRAGALSIGAFERGRWRLRLTRQAMGIESSFWLRERAIGDWCGF